MMVPKTHKIAYAFLFPHREGWEGVESNGDPVKYLQYLPFGESFIDQRNIAWATPYTFSAKEKDLETGYSYFGARYYNPEISIWLSVDPLVDDNIGISPYNYCHWNPLILIDPDGMNDGWYEGEDKQAHYDPKINSQQDMVDNGIKGRYVGQTACGQTQDGNMEHLNADGTRTPFDIAEIKGNKSNISGNGGANYFRVPSGQGVHDVSQAGLNFIAGFEGFSATTYKDVAGLPTIGYGHLIKQGESFGMLSQDAALKLLRKDASFAVNAVNKYVTIALTQNQFDALTSFTFNVGAGALSKSSLLRNVNNGNTPSIYKSFTMWNKARINGVLTPVKGLTNRRQAEANLFLYGNY